MQKHTMFGIALALFLYWPSSTSADTILILNEDAWREVSSLTEWRDTPAHNELLRVLPDGTEFVHLFRYLPAIQISLSDGSTSLALQDSEIITGIVEEEPVRLFQSEAVNIVDAKVILHGLPPRAGTGVSVAVIDNGVSSSSVPLCPSDNLSRAQCIRFKHWFVEEASLNDPFNSHGTRVARLIHSYTQAEIISLDVFDSSGIGGATNISILKAIEWAIAHQQEYNIRAINLSLGGLDKYTTPCVDTLFERLAEIAFQQGISIVAASGNLGWTDGLPFPACAPTIISVGSVHDEDGENYIDNVCSEKTYLERAVACYSNASSFLDILAPGSGIRIVSVPRDPSNLQSLDGTSFAAPFVTSVLALSAFFRGPQEIARAHELLLGGEHTIIDDRTGREHPLLNMHRVLEEFSSGEIVIHGPSTMSSFNSSIFIEVERRRGTLGLVTAFIQNATSNPTVRYGPITWLSGEKGIQRIEIPVNLGDFETCTKILHLQPETSRKMARGVLDIIVTDDPGCKAPSAQ